MAARVAGAHAERLSCRCCVCHLLRTDSSYCPANTVECRGQSVGVNERVAKVVESLAAVCSALVPYMGVVASGIFLHIGVIYDGDALDEERAFSLARLCHLDVYFALCTLCSRHEIIFHVVGGHLLRGASAAKV